MQKLINGCVWALFFSVLTICTVQLLQGIPYTSLSLQLSAAINTIAFYLASHYNLYGLPVGMTAVGLFSLPAIAAFFIGYRIARKV